MTKPLNSAGGVCEDDSWNLISSLPSESISTTIIVDFDVNSVSDYLSCLDLMILNNVTVYHEESLWNGLKAGLVKY